MGSDVAVLAVATALVAASLLGVVVTSRVATVWDGAYLALPAMGAAVLVVAAWSAVL
ncbi:MAG: hypothetical protein KQH83_07720 [Actinobacteria bacterium]|nr:hypothetical protein [Actinomycetota bacterium]